MLNLFELLYELNIYKIHKRSIVNLRYYFLFLQKFW